MFRGLASIGVLVFFFSFTNLWAGDLPGGLTQVASNPVNKFEMLLSPSFDVSPGGAYLTSAFRAQISEDVGLGAGFGAGELGFNLGGNATWYISPDLSSQPAFAVIGGLYFNRLNPYDYFLIRVEPVVSKSFKTDWGSVAPYAGMQLAPSFGLGMATGDFGIKTSVGSQFSIRSLNGVQLWTEFGFGIFHSNHELVVGMTYPFTSAGI